MLRVLACGFERQVLGLDLGNTMPQIGVHRGYGQHHHGDGHAHGHMLRFEEQNRQRTECDQRGPSPQDQHGATHRMHGRLAFGQTPHNRQTHVEHRQEQHQNRQQNWHEHRQIDAGMNRGRVKTSGHHNRSAGDEIAKQHRTGITHKQFGGMPIMQQEAHADTHHHHVDQRGQRSITRGRPGDDIRIGGERYATNRHDTGRQAIEAINEIDRVNRGDNQECGDRHGQTRRGGNQRTAQRQ